MKRDASASVKTRNLRLALSILVALSAIYAFNAPADAGRSGNPRPPAQLAELLRQNCAQCHDKDARSGGLDLNALSFDLSDRAVREQWIRIHVRVDPGCLSEGGRWWEP